MTAEEPGTRRSPELPPLAAEDHRCEACGIAYEDVTVEAALQALREVPAMVREALTELGSERLREPAPDGGWSATELACHLRDVYATYTIRLHRARTEDLPTLEPMLNDLRAARFRYIEWDVDAAVDELTATCAGFCEEIEHATARDWERPVRRLPGERRTARWLVRQAMHEGLHHVADIHALASPGRGPHAVTPPRRGS